MARLIDSVIDLAGNVVVGATVKLFNFPVKTLVATVATGSLGEFAFTAPAGRYALEITGAGIIGSRIVDDIIISDAVAALPVPQPGNFLVADNSSKWTAAGADCGRF